MKMQYDIDMKFVLKAWKNWKPDKYSTSNIFQELVCQASIPQTKRF